MTKKTSRAVGTKFEEENIGLKELCAQLDIIVEKLKGRPLFLQRISEQFKEDEPRLIRIRSLTAP